jgi:peptidoglycan LD-endopeptidase LytH
VRDEQQTRVERQAPWRCRRIRPTVLVAACIVAAGCTVLRGQPPLADALRARQLMVPVAGVPPSDVPDDFAAPRPGGRIHGAVDILAPRGTPVVAADAGRVLRLHRNAKGGLTIYATDEGERFVYYYAHLDRYRGGIGKGTRLARGQVIGYVGTTGNADRREPHLHFQVMARPSNGRWWNGEPIDPRPYFVSAGRAH